MKAELKLINIGKRKGEEIWEFSSGEITEIRGRTASGKSRILKSCALALSMPITSEEMRTTAISFGMTKAKNDKKSPLLNYSEKEATIELKYDKNNILVTLNQDGTENINTPGKQKFIYCSMLVENSKIYKYIDQGLSDFSWLVTELSLAKDYENIQGIINGYSETFDSKIEEIEKKKEDKDTLLTNKSEKEVEIKNIKKEIEILNKKIDDTPSNPKLKEQRQQILEDLKDFKRRLGEKEDKFKEIKKALSNIEDEISKNDKTIEKNNTEMKKLGNRIYELREIDEEAILNEEINKFHEKNKELYKIQGDLKEQIGGKNGRKLDYVETLETLKKKGIKETKCWICGLGMVSKAKVEEEINKVDKEINPLKTKLDNIEKEISIYDQKIIEFQNQKKERSQIKDLEEQMYNYSEENQKLGQKKKKYQKEKLSNEGKVKTIKAENKSQNEKIKLNEKDLKEKETLIAKDNKIRPIIEKKNKFTKQLGGLETQLSEIEEKLKEGEKVELFDKKLNISKAEEVLKDFQDIIGHVEKYLQDNINEQQEGAANKFNNNVQNVINELKLPKFEKVYLDLKEEKKEKKILLNIIRIGNPKPVAINSLSAGERVVISSILQISAKETYNPEIPFLIGDDIILKMDDERRAIFYNYLRDIAKKNDWFIILTRVTDEDLIKEAM